MLWVYSGLERRGAAYQWTGELDCEFVKEIHYEDIYDREIGEERKEIAVTVWKDGTERVLTDYIYPCATARPRRLYRGFHAYI